MPSVRRNIENLGSIYSFGQCKVPQASFDTLSIIGRRILFQYLKEEP